MASYRSFANRPWHTETDFEAQTRISIGSATGDQITRDVWCSCRESAENLIMASILDEPRPLRTMLNRIIGELIPQFGRIRSSGSYSHTVMVPNIVTTPSSRMPIVWKNLSGYYEDRFKTEPLVYGTDYTISGNTIKITNAESGDLYTVEYETTLEPTPGLLKTLSIYQTAGNVIMAKYGTDHARTQAWAEMYGLHTRRQIEMLRDGRIEIPEFASINLYADWSEGNDCITTVSMERV